MFIRTVKYDNFCFTSKAIVKKIQQINLQLKNSTM